MRRATKIGVGALVAGGLIAGAFLWLYVPPVDTGISPAVESETQPTKKPSDSLVYARAAVDAHKAGDLDQAIELYSKAIEVGGLADEKLAFAYNNRGAAQKGKGFYDLAIEDYSSAIRLRPGYARSYYNRAISYASTGSYELAIKDYGTAIELKPENASAFNNRALAREKLGRYDLAIDDLSQAIKLSPDLAYAYFNRGRIYQARDDWQRAVDDIKTAVSLNSNNPDYVAKLKELLLLEKVDLEPAAVPSMEAELLAAKGAAIETSDAPATVPSKTISPPATEETQSPLSKAPASGSPDSALPRATEPTATQLSNAPPTTDPTTSATTGAEEGGSLLSDENLILLIQGRLKEQGFDPGPIDGLMGPRTRTAIRDYQRKYDIAVDGKPSRQLLERLEGEPGSGIVKSEDG